MFNMKKVGNDKTMKTFSFIFMIVMMAGRMIVFHLRNVVEHYYIDGYTVFFVYFFSIVYFHFMIQFFSVRFEWFDFERMNRFHRKLLNVMAIIMSFFGLGFVLWSFVPVLGGLLLLMISAPLMYLIMPKNKERKKK